MRIKGLRVVGFRDYKGIGLKGDWFREWVESEGRPKG